MQRTEKREHMAFGQGIVLGSVGVAMSHGIFSNSWPSAVIGEALFGVVWIAWYALRREPR